MPPIGPWQFATVRDIRAETSRVKTFALALSTPTEHLAGQHFIVRLTAADGYVAQRSYSVATPPTDGTSIELTVERLPDGEVSVFLHDELVIGDTLEVRGPIGGWFVWDGTTPVLLIGGGSGVVPLMAMLRLARATGASAMAHLLVSARGTADLIYTNELDRADATVIYTRTAPGTATRPTRPHHRGRHRAVRTGRPDRVHLRIGWLCRRGDRAGHRGGRRAGRYPCRAIRTYQVAEAPLPGGIANVTAPAVGAPRCVELI